EDGIRDFHVTGVQTCALPIYHVGASRSSRRLGAPLLDPGGSVMLDGWSKGCCMPISTSSALGWNCCGTPNCAENPSWWARVVRTSAEWWLELPTRPGSEGCTRGLRCAPPPLAAPKQSSSSPIKTLTWTVQRP